MEESQRATSQLEEEMGRLRRNYEMQEQDRKLEVERLKRQVKEKDNLEVKHLERVEKLRKEKDDEIRHLEGVIAGSRKEYLSMVEEKNN